MNRDLERLYFDTSQPTAYAGAYQLLHSTRKNRKSKEVLDWLDAQDSHNLHRYARKKFPRRMYNIYNSFDLWEADLADLRSLKTYNDNYAYLLVVIDTFSKMAYVEPLKDKMAKTVAHAFEQILDRCNKMAPVCLQTDKGKEFVGKEMQNILKKYNITYRTVRSPDVKAAIAERFNRTLKGRLWRYFTHKHTRRYIDVLQQIVQSYNNSWHSGIKMAPSAVNLKNAAIVRNNLSQRYGQRHLRQPKYRVGDVVRVSREKVAFRKAYAGEWTLELFKIKRVSTLHQPPVYTLEDLAGEEIDGFFYEQELSKVNKDLNADIFEVDEILETKGRGRGKKYFVSWKGYPDKFNSWISANDLKQL